MGGGKRKYVPRRGRTLPLLSVCFERDKLPARGSQNRWEEEALALSLEALPEGVRPVVVGDRAFGRAGLIEWLEKRGIDYVLRVKRGCTITQADGRRWKLGEEGLRRGEVRWKVGVRYGTYHDRPRELVVNLACSWRGSKGRRRGKKGKEHQEPWYLVTSLGSLDRAVVWYRQRMWVEETFRDFHSGFGLGDVLVSNAGRLGKLVAALSLAVAWLHLLALPASGVLPPNWKASVVTCGRASLVSLALAFLDYVHTFPPQAPPRPPELKAA